LEEKLKAYKKDGSEYSNISEATFVPLNSNVYLLALPEDYMFFYAGKDFLIEVFSYAKNDNFSFPIEVTQHEAKEYFNTGIYLCVFEFSVPENAEKLLINLFKQPFGAKEFLCKFSVDL